jgi:hypothetical protein
MPQQQHLLSAPFCAHSSAPLLVKPDGGSDDILLDQERAAAASRMFQLFQSGGSCKVGRKSKLGIMVVFGPASSSELDFGGKRDEE